MEYEADPRHVEKLLRDLGMEACKPISTPGVKPVGEEHPDVLELLSKEEQTLFRGGDRSL